MSMDSLLAFARDNAILSLALLGITLALVYIANSILGAIPIDLGGGKRLSLDTILGWLFAPLMYVAGVPWEEAVKAGSFVGQKTVFTEFVAFINLGNLPAGEMTERTRTLVTYAICGFANVASVGITVAGLSSLLPERRGEVISLVWKALMAGFLANCMTASLVGLFPAEMFQR